MYNLGFDFEILSGGFFDSRIVMGKLTETAERTTCCFELEYIAEDGGTAFINDASYELKKGSLVFVKKGDVRRSKLHFKAYCIHFKILNKELESFFADNVTSFCNSADNFDKVVSKLIGIFDAVFIDEKNADLKIHIEKEMLGLIEMIVNIGANSISENSVSKKYPSSITSSIEFINDNYGSNISLTDIAKSAYLTPNYFHKLFLKTVGITAHEYLTNVRIKKAAFLLLSSDLPIDDISAQVGFSSQSYFTAVFKKHKKLTPLEYRKKGYSDYISYLNVL